MQMVMLSGRKSKASWTPPPPPPPPPFPLLLPVPWPGAHTGLHLMLQVHTEQIATLMCILTLVSTVFFLFLVHS